MPHLRDAHDGADDPRHPHHLLAASLGITEAHRVDDGEVAVNTDDNDHQRRQIEAERLPEHEEATGEVSGRPQHGGMPRHLDGDRDERYDQVGDGQVHDVEVDP